MIVEGSMQYLYDDGGRRYLDLFAGIVTVSCGHSHPLVNRRVIEQVERLQHATTLYLHPNFPGLAAKLAAKMPEGLDVTYFTNSGSEANELAVAMARLHTGREDVIGVRNAYHGGTATAMGLTSHSTWKFPLRTPGRIHHAACPDPYRSKFAGTPAEIATQSAEDIRELIRFSTPGQVAAFIAEPIQGVGGVTCGADNYLAEAYAVAREHGGICIADEVQTGFGRTGDHYWGFESYGVKPDMVVMAKGIGNGFPLGAVTTTAEIAAAFTSRIHFNTFGGNPVSMAAGSAVLDVIEQDGLQANCLEPGGPFKAGLLQLQEKHAVVGAVRGPTLTLFEVKLAEGVSVKKLKNQRDDLAVALGAHGVRIVYPLPGRTTVGIEVPNIQRENVFLKDVFEEAKTHGVKLPMVIGRDTLGKAVVEDLTKMPHMLVAGTTGSGKSVCLNSILMTMLLTRGPEQLRFVLIDPKQVEMQLYQDIPHLACPVVTDMKRAPFVLEWALRQMEDRLHQFKMAGVRNVTDYNELGAAELKKRIGEESYDPEEFPEKLPYVVLVIDELADMMLVSAKEVEIAISRLAAKARAAGIHLLVATQRPSTDVVTGLIKMNLPVRIAFKVTSSVDSRVILDDSGADLLLGNGDFLYRPPGAAGMTRGQGAFVSEKEVREACDHLRAHGKPEFIEDLVQMKGAAGGDGEVDDPLYDDAVRIILQSGRGSASLLQRALSIGYTRASRLIDIMSEQGVLGPFIGSKAREVLLTVEEWEAQREQTP